MGDISIEKIMEKVIQKPPGIITKEEVFFALDLVIPLLFKENNVLKLSGDIIVVGDIHGQLYDFLEIFKIEPPPPQARYLFLGDYVDRGYYSVEVLMYLVCLKIKYPDHIFLLRGNHECVQVTFTYGFYQECLEKFGTPIVSQRCCDMFNYLPISAVISNKIFAVHGGLSPSIHLIDQIDTIDRFHEPFEKGALPELLWADPVKTLSGFQMSRRGSGYYFGVDATKKFTHINGIQTICRAHQLVKAGYEVLFDEQLITVWSAPNYVYRPGNNASVMRVSTENDKLVLNFNVFGAVPDRETTIPPSKEVISSYFV